MADELTSAVRSQFLTYWSKATVNARPSGRSGAARVAEHVLNPVAPIQGDIVLDGVEGSGLLSLSVDTAYRILATLERLESALQNALDDGVTLSGSTEQQNYYTWQNTQVTSGTSKTSITAYDFSDRSNDIEVTASYGLFDGGIPSNTVDGEYGYDATNGWWYDSVDVAGHWIQFDFGSSRVVDEVTWQSLGIQEHGTWAWQGSNDGRTFYSIGQSFTLGGEGTQVQDSLKDNTTGYRYYRLYGLSGTAGSQLQQEVFFKSTPEQPEPASQAQVLTAASLNFIDADLADGRASIDNLVAAAESFGANLLSSISRSVLIRSTQYGGKLIVEAQPLDSQALGLTDVRAQSRSDAEDALAQLQTAILVTRSRIENLHTVNTGLQVGQSALSGNVGKGTLSVLPGGSLVNLLA